MLSTDGGVSAISGDAFLLVLEMGMLYKHSYY